VLLAIDVGNTQTHLGVFEKTELVHEWRASTDARRSADELALMFGEFLALEGLAFSKQISGVAVASVVPRTTQQLREMTIRYFGFPAVVVEPGVKTGLAVLTDNPKEVGADRICNAVAAHSLFPDEACVIVDFGTAIKVEAITARGEFAGGAIAPGMDVAASALFAAAARLTRVELAPPSAAIGKSTVTALQSGIIFGTVGLVDGLVKRVIEELGGNARVVATGGLASVVSEHCETIERIEPTLTLRGLSLIFERNTGAA